MSNSEKVEDGRVLRSQRSRQAIVDSAVRLVLDQGVMPTAQQIADAAGVTIRTFFRHFPEMDLIYREVHNCTIRSFSEDYLKVKTDGSLDERLRSTLTTFSKAYQHQQNIILVTKALSRNSEYLVNNYKKVQARLANTLTGFIPEISDLKKGDRETVFALMSFEFWNRMVNVQENSQKRYVEQVMALVKVVMEGRL